LSAGQKVLFHIELRMETLKVGQKLFFEMLSRVDASRREPTVPVCCSVLKRDDEKFGEGSFVPSS
jgi:hypothetical protein